MNISSKPRSTIVATLAMAVALGCSSREAGVETDPGADAPDPEETIQIEVENDLLPPQSVIVTFHATGQVERLLGTVLANRTETFTVDNRFALPPYFLVAETSGGPDLVSREIDATTAGTIRWSLGTNQIVIEN